MSEPWYAALCLIADESLPTFWRLSYGAAFWWMPDRTELLSDGFARQPFSYWEIASVTLFDSVPFADKVFTCDLTSMIRRLGGIGGLRVTEQADVSCPPVKPPNQALQLTAP